MEKSKKSVKEIELAAKARAAVMQAVEASERQGNVYQTCDDLVRCCLARNPYLTEATVKAAVKVLAADPRGKRLQVSGGRVARSKTLTAENELARICARRLAEEPSDIDWDGYIRQAESELELLLSDSQHRAAVGALSHSTSIITGGAGSGKTTLLRAIGAAYGVYCRQYDEDESGILNHALLMAPTGKAARRLSRQAELPAYTIHSVIYTADGSGKSHFYTDTGNLKAQLVIVDETSKVDIGVLHDLMRGLSPKSKLILVGDPHQLPSVGPGLVLSDLMKCGFPVFRLTDNFRLAGGGNALARNLDSIRSGSAALDYDDSFHVCPASSLHDVADTMLQLYVHFQMKGEDVQMLSPAAKTPACGTVPLNRTAHALLNPRTRENPGVDLLHENFRVGDRIVQLSNNRHGRNGDTGSITGIEFCGQPVVTIRFDAGNDVSYTATEIEKDGLLAHAYALTVHKAQGSEYDYVIIPLISSQGFMWNHNMVYTAVSRARKGAFLVGQESVLTLGIQRPLPSRNTDLLQKIRDCAKRSA